MSAGSRKSRGRLERLLQEIESDAEQAIDSGRLAPVDGAIVTRKMGDLKAYAGHVDGVLSIIETERGEDAAEWACECLRGLLFASFVIGRHGTVSESALSVIGLAEDGLRRIETAKRQSAAGAAGRRKEERLVLAKSIWAKHPSWTVNRVAKEIADETGDEVRSISRSIKDLKPTPAQP